MNFFNQKDEVIDIELTQYGKRMLSLGKFKPAHYAFFDKDILYNAGLGQKIKMMQKIELKQELLDLNRNIIL